MASGTYVVAKEFADTQTNQNGPATHASSAPTRNTEHRVASAGPLSRLKTIVPTATSISPKNTTCEAIRTKTNDRRRGHARVLEAAAGIEPAYKVLQTSA